MTQDRALVQVRDLKMHFPILRGVIVQRKVGAAKAVEGCTFHTRCRLVMDVCSGQSPEFRDAGAEHWVACHSVK